MFSRSSAISLRDSIAAGEPDVSLVRQYCNHYGLNFGNPDKPVAHRFHALDSGGFSIVMQRFSPSLEQQRGTAFLLHGYFDHAGLYGNLIDRCLQRGLSVVILDLPGHGLSSGPQVSIDSFGQYCRVLADCLELGGTTGSNRPWVCIGQSTGAAVLVDALLNHGLGRRFPLAQLILLAPLLRTSRWWRAKLSFLLIRRFLPRLKRHFSHNSHDPVFRKFLMAHDDLQSRIIPRQWIAAMLGFEKRFRKAAPLPQPLHIIQGTGDETVDWQYNLPALEKKFPGSTTYLIAGARHHLVNESPEYRDRVFTLLDDVLEKL